ncbi:hypothetical protein NIES37_01530 [Tolypothrix tenuis PCC 7101]|uniref:Uncharacterized protein n=1 Tax=Tolypothrix tenuis PCC 7101 TaxID=231146 RepID=A0A1Z4MRW2_9CYAN|nr:hypothetical protein [Aulosira sp. FACHB-113]BAY96224.1 hypothetical protein NIES37_01530 [Tolypothrix tenuis PCC 7101]BAZ73269.1 hypothetical protein NIES50_18310 [Aulosira laxa NIES-50]
MSMNLQVAIDKDTTVISEEMDKATTLFAEAISQILPDLAQLFQQYQVSGVLKTKLLPETSRGCTYIDGRAICTKGFRLELMRESVSFGETSTRDTETEQKFWTDIESKFLEMVDLLSQSIQEMSESFEVQFSIETATVNIEQPVVCQWDSNKILHCS